MTIDELIHELELIKNVASGDTEVLVEHNHQGACYDLQKPVCEWDLISKKRIVYLQLDESWIEEEKENSDFHLMMINKNKFQIHLVDISMLLFVSTITFIFRN